MQLNRTVLRMYLYMYLALVSAGTVCRATKYY